MRDGACSHVRGLLPVGLESYFLIKDEASLADAKDQDGASVLEFAYCPNCGVDLDAGVIDVGVIDASVIESEAG